MSLVPSDMVDNPIPVDEWDSRDFNYAAYYDGEGLYCVQKIMSGLNITKHISPPIPSDILYYYDLSPEKIFKMPEVEMERYRLIISLGKI